MILERRRQRDAELSSADVMKILRSRAAKVGRKSSGIEVPWGEDQERSGHSR
jgi:hypothetical protein